MKAAKAITKTFTIGLGLLSLVAVAETYYDRQFYTAKFMDTVKEVEIKVSQKPENRIVASSKKKLPIIQEVPLKMSSLVNGEWEITRVIDEAGEVVFDANKETLERVIVNMDLIALSTVRIDNDLDQTFNISLLTDQGTIALFKPFNEGYEIVEARRVSESEIKNSQKEINKPQPEVVEQKEEKASRYNIEEDLFLVSALDPKKNRNVLRANNVEGYAYLKNDELIIEGVRLHIGTKGQTEVLSTEARIQDHGVFNDGRGNQGVVTNVSNDEIKVRFTTGVLGGAMLNFVTYDKKRTIEEKFGTESTVVGRPQDQQNDQEPMAQQPINAQNESPEMYPENEPYVDGYVEEERYPEDEYIQEEAYYEEVSGERIEGEPIQYNEDLGQEFERRRGGAYTEEEAYERGPSSVEPAQVGFSF